MRMRARFVVAAVLALTAVAGATAPAGAATRAAATSTAPQAMTRQQAADYYLDWVCWANRANLVVATAFNGASARILMTPANKARARHAAKVFGQAAQALESPPEAWPANVVGPMADVVTSIRTARSGLAAVAAATTPAEVDAGMRRYKSSPNSGADRVRARLGLPPDGKDNGCSGRGQRP